MSHSHDPKDYSSSVMEFYGLDHVKFRTEKILDHQDFPAEYFIIEPVFQEHVGPPPNGGLVYECVARKRRRFVLDRVEKSCGWRFGFYHEVVD